MSEILELARLLAIGGSDPSGGAGIQADIKTGAAMGVDVCAVITAVTAQNSLGVQAVEPVPLEMVNAQLSSVCSDISIQAVKIGMLFDDARLEAVADAIQAYSLGNVVCDPVLASTSGTDLLSTAGVKRLASMLPLFSLLTPNVREAAVLSGREVRNSSELLDAGRALLDLGARAVLLKGGHLEGADSTDSLLQRSSPEVIRFTEVRVATKNDHGTGCVLSSGIASGLALGFALPEAIASARTFLQTAIEQSVHLHGVAGRGGMNLVHIGASKL